MITHHYQCDKCGLRIPIVYTGYDITEYRDRLPEGWALVYTRSQNQSYCSSCWNRMFKENN